MLRLAIVLVALVSVAAPALTAAQPNAAPVATPKIEVSKLKITPAWPGRKGRDFRGGFTRHDFQLDGVGCIVVSPKTVAPGKPWIWRARFFGHEPQADAALLARGFHVAYCNVGGLFGSPQAVARWNKFYAYLTTKHGFSKKPALEGMSRGGLIIYNWAAANPKKVSCIYGDAPVCDFKSWPGGKGKGKGSRGDWQQCLKVYGFTEAQAMAYKRNPIDNLKPLADAKVPLLNVCGDADPVVPMAENTTVLAERYRKLGGKITVIAKKGVGHHPHSLKDPKLIVDFVLKHTAPPMVAPK
ncbi:MAG: prolyl oligopeptidase family serine peptidase [Phycisphaerae bacterium]|nr:prolyl oligopeptidase family serine peptidase [Phycisphaerae bacterium]